jgi:DNA polymerase III delta subunit
MKAYLFTWEENYLLHKELQKRKEGFLTKHGPDTVLSMSLGQHTTTEIIQALCSSGLFGDNKLIIISGIPGETTSPWGTTDLEEQIVKYWNSLNEDYFYIFISPKPDKRKKAFKFFSEHCEVKTFSKMDMRTLPKFINEEVQRHLSEKYQWIIIDKERATEIVNIVWDDGRNLAHECEKLALAINLWKPLSSELLHTILTPLTESNNFGILEDLIKQSPSIYHTLDNLSSQGETRQGIQGSLLRWLKTIVWFGACIQHNQDPRWLWLPPFTLSKYNGNKESIIWHLSAYQSLYHDLIDFDYQVKTGNASDGGYWLFIKEKAHTYFWI